MKLILFFILSFLLMTISCTKFGKNITVKGKVINPVTGVGIPNLEVSLQRSKLIGFPSAGVKTLKTTRTDAEGFFKIDALNHAHYDYVVRVNTEGLYDLGWYDNGKYKGTDTYGVDVGKVTNVDFHAVPYGEEEIHYNNINCQGELDTLKQYFDGSYIPYANVQIGLYGYVTGCVDVTTNPVRFPMGERYYHWEIIRNGVIESVVYDTIFIQPNQVNTLEIIY